MLKNLIFLIAVMFLFSGCTSRQIMLSKLEKSEWYRIQNQKAETINTGVVEPGFAYIVAGKVKKVSYSYPRKNIDGISLHDPCYLTTPFFWDKIFIKLPESFYASNDDFPSGDLPAVGEYWVFGLDENFRGGWSVRSAAKLLYNDQTKELKIIDSGGTAPEKK